MDWGTVEHEPEVSNWLAGLPQPHFVIATTKIRRLANLGPFLREPHTRQLRGKLRELRFGLDGNAVRVTYWIASEKRIILLTVFCKTREREEREVQRAWRVFQRCVQERHTAEDHRG